MWNMQTYQPMGQRYSSPKYNHIHLKLIKISCVLATIDVKDLLISSIPFLDTVPPQFVSKPQNAHVAEGKSVTVTCQVSGYPAPEVRWYRLGREIAHGRKFQIGGDGNIHTLTANQLFPEDVGEISVTVTNKGGTITDAFELNVLGEFQT